MIIVALSARNRRTPVPALATAPAAETAIQPRTVLRRSIDPTPMVDSPHAGSADFDDRSLNHGCDGESAVHEVALDRSGTERCQGLVAATESLSAARTSTRCTPDTAGSVATEVDADLTDPQQSAEGSGSRPKTGHSGNRTRSPSPLRLRERASGLHGVRSAGPRSARVAPRLASLEPMVASQYSRHVRPPNQADLGGNVTITRCMDASERTLTI